MGASDCALLRWVRMYDGPTLPSSKTSSIAVQPDHGAVVLQIEAVDGKRMPGAEREFYFRDKAAIVEAGEHTVEVRG